ARNADGRVILYADNMTNSIDKAIEETDRRRNIQLAYNKKHGITPQTIQKSIRNILEEFGIDPEAQKQKRKKGKGGSRGAKTLALDTIGDDRPIKEQIKDREQQMKEAAKNLEFELAAILRDEIHELKKVDRKK
ncbi:MAG: excinuclease ABC subunit UvrB, partial [Candidatus Magasanikbacteria bacterium CG10_big_fil_rev_8_21_14_0_10_38_6]